MGDISEKIQLVFIQFAQVVFFHSFDADIHFVSHTHLVEADNYKTDKKSDKRINSDHETTQQKVRTNVNGYFPTVEYNSVFSYDPYVKLVGARIEVGICD